MNYPRLVLGGAHSGVGKTSISLAVLGILTARGVRVQPWKVGPDYIDPAFHTFVTGRASRNLDSWIVASEELKKLFAKNAPLSGEGVSIIEGVMGLFDGNGTTSEGGTAHVAKILAAPVVLAVGGEGIARSLAALVRGYRDFDPELNLAGIIINRVSSARHYELLKGIVENETGLRCFGYLPKDPGVALEHRPLGLIPPSEIADARRRLELLAELGSKTLDVDGLMDLAAGASPLDAEPPQRSAAPIRARIGIPRDAAFCAWYEDNLDLLRELGADLAFFDAIETKSLPDGLNGLYIGGGFPEIFASGLSANAALREDIRRKLENGMPAYAEGAGVTWLCRTLTDAGGRKFDMAGFFDDDARVAERLPNFGHVAVTLNANTPLGGPGTRYRANEFHRLKIEPRNSPAGTEGAYRVEKPGGLMWPGGMVKKNAFASLVQVHFYADRSLAENFLKTCAGYTPN